MAEKRNESFFPEHLQGKMEMLKGLVDKINMDEGNSENSKSSTSAFENEDLKPAEIKNTLASCKKELNKTKEDIQSIKNALDIIAELKTAHFEKVNEVMQGSKAQCKYKVEDILQQSAETLPLFVANAQENAPPLCGAIQVDEDYVPQASQMVAAFVSVNGEDTWILARIGRHTDGDTYEVHDFENQDSVYSINRSRIIPLPTMRANPTDNLDAIFRKDSLVLALYPKTTCFYKAVVYEQPNSPGQPYTVAFEDTSCSTGFSTPTDVPQQYVLYFKDPRTD